jgi:hypothetical protein
MHEGTGMCLELRAGHEAELKSGTENLECYNHGPVIKLCNYNE